jgi:hypothetical protein
MEISESLGFMYRQIFKNFPEYVWIAAGIHPKSQNLFRLCIRPQKTPHLFGLANQASKNTNLFGLALKWPILLGLIPNDRQTTNCK